MAEYSALGPVQKAVNGLLKADNTAMATLKNLYDEAPAGAAFPYLTFGDDDHETAMNSFTEIRREITLVFECWSKTRSYKESSLMVSVLVNSLANADDALNALLTPDGWRVEQILYIEAGPKIRDTEGIARQIPVTFAITVEQTP